jgi:hypothetical protein
MSGCLHLSGFARTSTRCAKQQLGQIAAIANKRPAVIFMDGLLAYASSSSDSENDSEQQYVAPSQHFAQNNSGLFPTFVFFPVALDAPLRVTIDDAIDAILCLAATATPIEDLHITVSGTLMLRRDQVRTSSTIVVLFAFFNRSVKAVQWVFAPIGQAITRDSFR